MPTETNRPPPALDRRRAVWVTAALVWGVVALIASTQQWAALRGTVKAITWTQAFAWQGVSWLLLIPATPILYAVVRRYPLDRDHMGRLVVHAAGGLAFGFVFLLVSLPARLAFHPSGMRWAFFGEAFYKSVVPYGAAGAFAYGLVVLAASLSETRGRLAATRVDPPVAAPRTKPRIAMTTPVGVAHQRVHAALWAEPGPSGATLHTDDGPLPVRHRIGELEAMLAPFGFVRVHRGVLVNGHRVREVIGAPSRDGLLRLDTGQTLPVSRRRRARLDGALAALADGPANGASRDGADGVPFGG